VLTFSVNRAGEQEEQPAPLTNRLAVLRRERGLSRQELASLLAVHPTTLAALEEGSYLPSLRLAFQLSEFFALPVDELFFSPAAGHSA
jgi:DNA-binding XRE family transcriptional regulator